MRASRRHRPQAALGLPLTHYGLRRPLGTPAMSQGKVSVSDSEDSDAEGSRGSRGSPGIVEESSKGRAPAPARTSRGAHQVLAAMAANETKKRPRSPSPRPPSVQFQPTPTTTGTPGTMTQRLKLMLEEAEATELEQTGEALRCKSKAQTTHPRFI